MHWLCLAVEIAACLACMRSLNLAYDGVVLLVVADLMHRYEGRNQGYLLIGAMLVLYALADYSLAAFGVRAVPFDAYTGYYEEPVRALLSALRTMLTSLNLVLFVGYLVIILKGSHAERQRIANLNAQLHDANVRLRAYAIEAERTAETRERNRLAREIHDTLGHALTGIAAGLDACIVMVDSAPDFTKQQLVKIRETALRGITNANRHGHAERQTITITVEQGKIYLLLYDDGEGAPIDAHGRVKEGFGLKHMKERVGLLHGTVDYESGQTYGTRGFSLTVIIPERKDAEMLETSERKDG